jgi:hypothetical protein
MTINLANKKDNATGTTSGQSVSTQQIVTADQKCTSTGTLKTERTAAGSGKAFLHKASTDKGSLALSFAGPGEPTNTHATNTSQSSCPGSSPPGQPSDTSTPAMSQRGEVTDTLDNAFAERITGSKTLRFVLNASGAPNVAQQTTSGSVVRSPAVPGGPVIQSQYVPWLTVVPGANTQPEDYPVIQVQITWNLAFGGS